MRFPVFENIYRQRRVFITGHTGFKGSWLWLWLKEMGADVYGLSLDPVTNPNHWDLLAINENDFRGDIRNIGLLEQAFQTARPEIVFHLAAQPLVRRSYHDPLETWSTNVIGTANVLEVCRRVGLVRAVVVATTDKCYQNREQLWGYRETEPLGGHDPYSASKAAAEMVAASYRQSFFSGPGSALVATARAGNVIGGGDWSQDRLIPDVARAVAARSSLEIRSPRATRPWQHVLECLSGYLLLGQHLLQGKSAFADAWNFGPGSDGNRTVLDVLRTMKAHWPYLTWHQTSGPQPHEATLLQLDSTKACRLLGWEPVWSIDKGIIQAAHWYHAFYNDGQPISHEQLKNYIEDARQLERSWAAD